MIKVNSNISMRVSADNDFIDFFDTSDDRPIAWYNSITGSLSLVVDNRTVEYVVFSNFIEVLNLVLKYNKFHN
jgi:hypothetical protein